MLTRLAGTTDLEMPNLADCCAWAPRMGETEEQEASSRGTHSDCITGRSIN